MQIRQRSTKESGYPYHYRYPLAVIFLVEDVLFPRVVRKNTSMRNIACFTGERKSSVPFSYPSLDNRSRTAIAPAKMTTITRGRMSFSLRSVFINVTPSISIEIEK
jgi:hypothetical protein